MSELTTDNVHIITIDMSDPTDIINANKFISHHRMQGMDVVQRSLVYDKTGVLWCVVFMETPRNVPEPESTTVHIDCHCEPRNVHTVEPVLELHARSRLRRSLDAK